MDSKTIEHIVEMIVLAIIIIVPQYYLYKSEK